MVTKVDFGPSVIGVYMTRQDNFLISSKEHAHSASGLIEDSLRGEIAAIIVFAENPVKSTLLRLSDHNKSRLVRVLEYRQTSNEYLDMCNESRMCGAMSY